MQFQENVIKYKKFLYLYMCLKVRRKWMDNTKNKDVSN